jgi:hypothetical protein
MKTLISYYFWIIIPFPFMAYLAFNRIEPLFIISLLAYGLIYRPITDGIKLKRKGLIKDRKDYWKLFIWWAQLKWFKELYLKK